MNTPTPNIYTTTQPPAPKSVYRYTNADFILAICLWVVGFLFSAVTPVMEHPIPAFLLEVILFVGAAVLLTRRFVGGKLSVRAVGIIAVSLVLSLSLLVTTNRAIVNCVFIWNCLSWFYLVFVMTDNSKEHIPGGYFVGELLTASVVMPFRAPGNLFGALFGGKRNPDGSPRPRGRVGSTVGWVCLGLGMAIVPTIIVSLLLSYDDGFNHMMKTIFDNLLSADEVFRQIKNVILGLLIGAFLFGAVLAGKHKLGKKPATDTASADRVNTAPATDAAVPARSDISPKTASRDGLHVLPVALVAATLTPILAIYVIFFISQWDYYMSAFTGIRPEELTYATYAREGFFQLVVVAVINAVLGLVASVCTLRRPADPACPRRERTSPVMRMYLAVLSVFTLILIATALAKMFLYVDTYGMTQKRIYATWLMLLLAVCFVAVLLRQAWTRMNLTGTLLAVFLAFLMAISVLNVDHGIMQYNVNAALDGNLRTMQGEVLTDCGYSGVLPALDFMEATADPDFTLASSTEGAEEEATEKLISIRATVDTYLARTAKELEKMKWYEHNPVTLRARAALREAGYGA